ncbi:hypothetical protein ACC848_43625, partial [Rhizobium johnstonii]
IDDGRAAAQRSLLALARAGRACSAGWPASVSLPGAAAFSKRVRLVPDRRLCWPALSRPRLAGGAFPFLPTCFLPSKT